MEEWDQLVRKASSLVGYAHHEIIEDARGVPLDFRYLAVNAGFEAITGLKKELVVGRRVTEVFPGISDPHFDWIGMYGQIAAGGNNYQFKKYFRPLGKWFSVSAFSTKKRFFSTYFQDITPLKIRQKQWIAFFSLFHKQYQQPAGLFDGTSLLSYLVSITGAKIILFFNTMGRKDR